MVFWLSFNAFVFALSLACCETDATNATHSTRLRSAKITAGKCKKTLLRQRQLVQPGSLLKHTNAFNQITLKGSRLSTDTVNRLFRARCTIHDNHYLLAQSKSQIMLHTNIILYLEKRTPPTNIGTAQMMFLIKFLVEKLLANPHLLQYLSSF